MIESGPALLVLLPIALYGLHRIAKDAKSAWQHRRDPSAASRVARARVAAWFASWIFAAVMAVDALLGGPPMLFVVGGVGIAVAWLTFLVLSFVWGAMGGPDS